MRFSTADSSSGSKHFALCVDALRHFEGEAALDQRLRTVEEQIERLDAVAAPDRIDVAKSFGGDQRGARAFALQHRVDRHRRAVQHFGKCRHCRSPQAEAFRPRLRRIGRHGGCFRGHDPAVDAADQIGEGAANIRTGNIHAHFQRVKRRSAIRTISFIRSP